MKTGTILWITSAFLLTSATTVLAGDSQHKQRSHMMNKSHDLLKQNSRMMLEGHKANDDHAHKMDKMSSLVKSKKSEIHSKNKYFTAYMDKVPGSPGKTMFTIRLKNAMEKPLSSKASIKGTLRMPGMKMDLPPVKVKQKNKDRWMLATDLPMAGLWKIQLIIKDQGVQDKLTIKFIAQ